MSDTIVSPSIKCSAVAKCNSRWCVIDWDTVNIRRPLRRPGLLVLWKSNVKRYSIHCNCNVIKTRQVVSCDKVSDADWARDVRFLLQLRAVFYFLYPEGVTAWTPLRTSSCELLFWCIAFKLLQTHQIASHKHHCGTQKGHQSGVHRALHSAAHFFLKRLRKNMHKSNSETTLHFNSGSPWHFQWLTAVACGSIQSREHTSYVIWDTYKDWRQGAAVVVKPVESDHSEGPKWSSWGHKTTPQDLCQGLT